jgi:hypothetical protein
MNISRATAEELTELLEDLLEYMDQRADCESFADGTHNPNKEMRFLVSIQEALQYLRFPDDPS